MLRLPREIRSMIYEYVFRTFKAYSGAFVTSDLCPVPGDVYMFDTGAWYSVKEFKGEAINSHTILELDAAPLAHQNVPHLFNRTPARHLRSLHPQIWDECVDDICLKAGQVRLSMQYRNHVNPHSYDKLLVAAFVRHARDLTITIAYTGIYSATSNMRVTTLGYNREPGERITAVDDLATILRNGCRLRVLRLYFIFDIPFTDECRLTVNETWVQDEVAALARFGCEIELCIYNRCDERYQGARYECPTWEHMFSYCSSYSRRRSGWSPWQKHEMSVYEAAALECR